MLAMPCKHDRQDVHPMLGYCLVSFVDGGPELGQHWMNVFCGGKRNETVTTDSIVRLFAKPSKNFQTFISTMSDKWTKWHIFIQVKSWIGLTI